MQENLEIRARQSLETTGAVCQEGIGQRTLALLQLRHLLLDRVTSDDAIGEDGPLLTDAVRAIDGLGLDRWIPPWVEEKDVLRGSQIEPEPSRFEADQEELALRVGLEPTDGRLAIAGRLAVAAREPIAT